MSIAVKHERGNTDIDDTDLYFDTVWRSTEDRFTLRANLDSRFFIGPYLGKNWYEQAELDLETELGVVYVITEYIDSEWAMNGSSSVSRNWIL